MLKAPANREKILGMGGVASGNSPDEFAAFIKAEMDKWAKVEKAAKVRLD